MNSSSITSLDDASMESLDDARLVGDSFQGLLKMFIAFLILFQVAEEEEEVEEGGLLIEPPSVAANDPRRRGRPRRDRRRWPLKWVKTSKRRTVLFLVSFLIGDSGQGQKGNHCKGQQEGQKDDEEHKERDSRCSRRFNALVYGT